MAHLSRLGIGNFRVFNETYHFHFNPITILTGTNSSGKSSLIKTLLLLLKSDKILDGLEFNSSLNLGNFDTVKNKWSGSNKIVIELPFIFPSTTAELTLRLEYEPTRNDIKNATLANLKLLDLKTSEVFIHFGRGPILDESDKNQKQTATPDEPPDEIIELYDELRINFTGLWKIFKNSIDRKKANSADRLDNLKSVNRYFGETSEANKVDSLRQTPIYYKEVDSNLTLKNETLLNYLFLYDIDWVTENLAKLFPDKNKNEVTDLLIELSELNKRFNQLASREKLSISEYVQKKELEFLDGKKFFNSTRYEYGILGWGAIDSFLQIFKELSNSNVNSPQRGALAELSKGINDVFSEKLKEEFIIKDKILKQDQKTPTPSNNEIFFKNLLLDGFRAMTKKYKNIFNEINYVSSIRTKVDRLYRLGKGESELNDLLYEFHSIEISKDAQEFLNKCVEQFEIADSITIKVVGASYASNIQLNRGSSKSTLADLGYGISQLMPILLRISIIISRNADPISGCSPYYFPSILIIEEPETNLHPKLQSKLAEMFVECYNKYNIQLIIETHSEYLIRKLQYLTAKKDVSTDLTRIYYFNNPDTLTTGEKQVKEINIEEDGNLTDSFGSGFFDEADIISLDIFKQKYFRN